jgi:4-hydroxybenzoyl-CoA reductase subunit alpha
MSATDPKDSKASTPEASRSDVHPHGLPRQKHGLIGKRLPLVDARRKSTGQAVYTDDIQLPGMLVCKILRSPHAHARIVSIDTRRAEALPGVHAVVTGKDAPHRFGVLPVSQDELAMAIDKALYVGDNIAAVAADDEETAIQALKLIDIEWEELRPFLKMEESLEQVEPELRLHEKTVDGTNIHKQVQQNFGSVSDAWEQAAWKKRQTFKFPGITHAFTEPMCTLAHYDADGRMNVWSAQQVPHYLHRAMAKVLDMPMHKIRIIRPTVGGGFGGKSDPFPHEMICALLSRKCKRPVKVLFDREEVFYSNHGRHPSRIDVALSVDADKKISGLEVDALIDGGAWGSFGVVTTYYNGVLANGPYRVPNFKYRGRRIYSNRPPSGAMRGHGAVNTRYAYEVLLDEAAHDLGVNPAQMRLENALESYTKTINEFRITSNGVKECIERACEASGFMEKHGKLPFGEGLGIACGFYISGSALPIHWDGIPQSTVHLKIDLDGGVTIHSLAAEIGQGSDTMLAQIVADVLGIGIDWCRVRSEDTDTAPIDLGSYSSRVTFMAGNAARKAAENMRSMILEGAASVSGYPKELLVLQDEHAVHVTMPEVRVPYRECVQAAMKDRGALQSSGCYKAAPPMGGKFKGAAAGLSPTYTFQAFVVHTQIDLETGKPNVKEVWAAHDCGRALNPMAVEGQIEGSVHMGLGQVLCEDFEYNRANVLNPNFLDYRTLSPKETPKIHPIIVETYDPEGPFGAKEAGEGPLLPILPAVANSIFDAIGERFYELPITADRIWRAMQRSKKQSAHA